MLKRRKIGTGRLIIETTRQSTGKRKNRKYKFKAMQCFKKSYQSVVETTNNKRTKCWPPPFQTTESAVTASLQNFRSAEDTKVSKGDRLRRLYAINLLLNSSIIIDQLIYQLPAQPLLYI